MNDEINKNPLPRVIKGTGFFTPMDLAPGETLAPAPAAPSPDPAASTQPTAPVSAPPAQEPPQSDSSSNGSDS